MNHPSWLIDLDRAHSSYLVLISLLALLLAGGILFYFGVIGWIFWVLGLAVGASIRKGFLLWERLLSWASWPVFLTILLGFLLVGGLVGGLVPGLRILCGLAPLLMGGTACLAYMFIDLERYEVERGHKAVHNPLQGQELAVHLAEYGQQVRFPLLIAATVGLVGGFALLNQGLYETIGRDWFRVEGGEGGPIYADFLAYALINLLSIVDVLNLAQSNHFLRSAYVHQVQWPASTLLAAYKAFFTLVLLQQIFASLRQGKLLAETITDLWNPHEPIHERARNALPQYGGLAIRPLLVSLRLAPPLTKEQRDQLPLILAMIGPSTIPALLRHLDDAHPHVRAIAAAALGQLHALDSVPLLVPLARDPSDMVRQSLVEALGLLGSAGTHTTRPKSGRGWRLGLRGRALGWLFARTRPRHDAVRAQVPAPEPVAQIIATLESALADASPAVRTQAALALGRIGPAAAAVAPRLIALLKDADETVRCQATPAGPGGAFLSAMAALMRSPSLGSAVQATNSGMASAGKESSRARA